MSDEMSTADVYTDFNRFNDLRLKARQNDPKALAEVSKQFEAMFIQMALKAMRSAEEAFRGDLIDNRKIDYFQGMFDEQITLAMTSGNGIGLADILKRQIEQYNHGAKTESLPSFSEKARMPPLKVEAVNPVPIQENIPSEKDIDQSTKANRPIPSTPTEFIKAIIPHAVEIAKDLKLDPKILIAQAVLETGWGKSIMKHADGRLSHNLFGIKAEGSWDREAVTQSTLEFRDGIAVKEKAKFRSYPSFLDSFIDYRNFLKNNLRYSQALKNSDNPKHYLEALQDAGYATDPQYANKIKNLYYGDHLQRILQKLKF